MTSENPFSTLSSQYSQWRPQYPDALFHHLTTLCSSHDRAWDCATGNGQAAADLAKHFAQVDATDISAEQISYASPSENVHYSVQPAEATTFPHCHFDLVTVAQALHWFDHVRFWEEVHRVLKPNGVFAAWAYIWPHVTPDIDAVVTKKVLDVIEPYWSSKNRLAWNGYRELHWPFMELPAPKIELSCEWSCDEFLSYLRTWSATNRCIQQKGDHFFREFQTALRDVWDTDMIRTVNMDFCCRLGRKASES